MSNSSIGAYGTHAEQLFSNGFQPLAVDGKKPQKGWPSFEMPPDEEIRTGYIHTNRLKNIGLCTGSIVVIDIDCDDKLQADEAKVLAQKHLGYTPFKRIGKAPRVALFYRTNTPRRKLKKVNNVEILGAGQMVVVSGIHPVTKKPYMWPEESILDATPDELPLITEENLMAFYEALGGTPEGVSSPMANLASLDDTGKDQGKYIKRGIDQGRNIKNKEKHISEGERNDQLFKYLCIEAITVNSSIELDIIAERYNAQFSPPLPFKELQSVVSSVWRLKETGQLSKPSEQFMTVSIARKQFEKITHYPPALCLLYLLKGTRSTETFSIPQDATAKYLGWGHRKLQRSIKVLIDSDAITLVGKAKPEPKRFPAILYRFT